MNKSARIIIALTAAVLICLSTAACDEIDKVKSIDVPALPTVSAAPEAVQTPKEETEVNAVTDSGAVVTTANNINKNSVTICVYQNTDTVNAPDKDENILLFSYDSPVVSIENNEAATNKINDYLKVLDEAFYTGTGYNGYTGIGYNAMLERAEENYYMNEAEMISTNLEFINSRSVSVLFADSSHLTLLYTDYEYTGEGTGIYYNNIICFNTVTGSILSADAITGDTQALLQELSDALNIEDTEHLSFGILGDCIAVAAGADKIGEADGRFELIPFANLKSAVYTPVNASKSSEEIAEFSISDDDSISDMYIFDRVVDVAFEDTYYICLNGIAENVKISRVEYSDAFYETKTLWYGSFLKDCAIQLETLLPEGMPSIMISYTDYNNAEVKLFLTQNGMTGKPELSSEEITAVG